MAKKVKDELVEQIREVSKKKIKSDDVKIIPTGITLLDLVLGGGWPIGTIVNIVGGEGSGKTYLALETIVYALKHVFKKGKLKFRYNDAEGGFSFDTKKMYGVEIVSDEQRPSLTVEDFGSDLQQTIDGLAEDETLIYVLDSLDGLSSEAERNRDGERQKAFESGKEYDKGTYAMEKQKFLSQFFRLRAGEIKHKNVILIIISQVRFNITGYGEKYTRSGGKALDHSCSTILWLYDVEKKKRKDRAIGQTVKAKTKKARIATPFRECFLDLIFDYGVDDINSNICFLYDLRTPQGKEGGKVKVEWDGKEYNKSKLISYIEENNLEEVLAARVKEKWNEIEDSISSKGRKDKWK